MTCAASCQMERARFCANQYTFATPDHIEPDHLREAVNTVLLPRFRSAPSELPRAGDQIEHCGGSLPPSSNHPSFIVEGLMGDLRGGSAKLKHPDTARVRRGQ